MVRAAVFGPDPVDFADRCETCSTISSRICVAVRRLPAVRIPTPEHPGGRDAWTATRLMARVTDQVMRTALRSRRTAATYRASPAPSVEPVSFGKVAGGHVSAGG